MVRLLENLKVKNVSFIGHAMGGRVGMYTALHRYPVLLKTSHCNRVTINVPVVYMARYEMILMRAPSIPWAIGRGGV